MPETRRYCPHCEEHVSSTTFRRHKQLYYNQKCKKWHQKSQSSSESEMEYSQEDVCAGHCVAGLEGVVGDLMSESICDEERMDDGEGEDGCAYKCETDEEIVEDGDVWENILESDIEDDLGDSQDAVKVSASREDGSGIQQTGGGGVQQVSEAGRVGVQQVGEQAGWGGVQQAGEQAGGNGKVREIVQLLVLLLCRWSSFYKVADNCFNSLLKVIGFVLFLLAKVFPAISTVSLLFPKSLHSFKKEFGQNKDKFVRYVVCKKCHSIYLFEDCFDKVGSVKTPRKCSFIAFPRHPHKSRRQPCGEKLLAEVILEDGTRRYYPRKVYCYNSLIDRLGVLVKRDGFLDDCEHWRRRILTSGLLGDVYDGKVWKEFQHVGGQPFLAAPHNLGLMLNVDWFNPFKHTQYSVGVMYLVVMNLPRSKRYKIENVIIVGLIPGPSEPPLHLNSYLDPLVEELQQLWKPGVQYVSLPTVLRAAVLCVACDVPAARKVCGFLGHTARLGCSKCLKEFVTGSFGDKVNYGGFSECSARNESDHREQAQRSLEKNTASSKDGVERESGSRFTSLMHLEYFNCVRYHIIDPMHNLFGGTAKHIMNNIWLKEPRPLIPRSTFCTIQQRIDNCSVPASLGRIPHKVLSGFASLTADEWKNWTTIFSVYALFGVLGIEHLECWRLFVLACKIISSPLISLQELDTAHELLLGFCKEFERIYGSDAVTPNMHLHMHLADCIRDFGPVYGFWLFSFERYNGFLGKYPTNNRSVEIQIMKKFCRDLAFREVHIQVPEEMPSLDFLDIQTADSGKDLSVDQRMLAYTLSCLSVEVLSSYSISLWSEVNHLTLGGSCKVHYLELSEKVDLVDVYKVIYQHNEEVDYDIPLVTRRYRSVEFNDQCWGSESSRLSRSSYVLASWCGRDGKIDPNMQTPRPGIVSFYFKHHIKFYSSSSPKYHVFAYVRWFSPHPCKDKMGRPVEVWCANVFERAGPASFIPFQRLHTKFVAGFEFIDSENVLCVCPLNQKIFI